MEKESQELLKRIRDGMEGSGPTATILHDCLVLARRSEKPEWELYFELQLVGLTPGGDGAPLSWQGDAAQLAWQPVLAFEKDRRAPDGKVLAHSFGQFELICAELGKLSSQSVEVDALGTKAGEIERTRIEFEDTKSRLKTRTLRFLAELDSMKAHTSPGAEPKAKTRSGESKDDLPNEPKLVASIKWLWHVILEGSPKERMFLVVATVLGAVLLFAAKSGMDEDFANSLYHWLQCHQPSWEKRPLDCALK